MKLSIIIVVFNQEKLIKRALRSIPATNDIEIIIVNDGSTDHTSDTILEFVLYNQRVNGLDNVKIFNNPSNMGAPFSKNIGVANATGEYITFLDSDDFYYTGALKKFMDELTGEDLVYFIREKNNKSKITINEKNIKMIGGHSRATKRIIYEGLKYDESLKFGEDTALVKLILAKHPTIKYTDHLVYHYNSPREDSLTWIYKKDKLKK